MSYTSPEILQLEAIRDWIASLTVWQTWTGLAETPAKARVVWPLKSAPTLPVCVLSLNGGRLVNLSGAAGGSNFQPSGIVTAYIYAADTAPTDPQVGYSDFADLFYQLIAAMADAAHQAPVLFNEFTTPELPIVHSSWVNFEETDEGLADWWQGQLVIRWGVDQ
tara:strand:+ start:2729 stop:3220 length:492 start_codon:yes stop_codon:yes gene_type:complete